MTKLALVKAPVLREQRRALELVQQRKHIVVMNAGAGDFFPDLPKGNSPPFQKHPLIVADVLVQQIHAANWPFNRRFNRPLPSSSAAPARRIVSRIAALVTRPPHAFSSSSTDSPYANASRICQTMMRVPL